MSVTPSGPRRGNGLPSNPTDVGSGGISFHGGQHEIGGEVGDEPSNPDPVGGNPTVTQEINLLTQDPFPNQPLPARQEGGIPPQDPYDSPPQ